MILNRWNDTDAKKFVKAAANSAIGRDLALRIYSSRLIGQDADLVMHGGGNTSCKVTGSDIFGKAMPVLHIKGSGANLGSIDATGLPAVRLAPLLQLRTLDGLSDENMINILRSNLLEYRAPTPSVETLLHAFLPHRFIDHTHATPMLALANIADVKTAVAEIFGPRVACVPFVMSGIDLAKIAADIVEENPEVEGLLLINHGHVAFGDTARQSYDRLIEQTNMVEHWLAKSGTKNTKFAKTVPTIDPAEILPMLRGIIGNANAGYFDDRDYRMPVLEVRNSENIQEFLTRDDLFDLSKCGVATPDHVIRTKNYPLFLSARTLAAGRTAVQNAVDEYVGDYTSYFAHNAARFAKGEKTMLAPTPKLAWVQGLGIVGIAENASAASACCDLGAQNISVLASAEAVGGFKPIDTETLFDMEYWSLEQAKLKTGQKPYFKGKIVMVTGGGGAIGLATAQEFAAFGANIFLVDLGADALEAGLAALGDGHAGIALDITEKNAANRAMAACVQRFGGIDILISNAGAAWTGEMSVLNDETLRKSFELNFFAHQTFSKAAAAIFETQTRGGQILFNVSKQAVNPGKGFGAYGIPKAATFFLLRQLALELGPKGVRVNGINADRIRSGLLDEAFVAERAKARGIDEQTYMAGNLIRREVEAKHVAQAFVALAKSERTTAHVITVDGGNIEAALR